MIRKKIVGVGIIVFVCCCLFYAFFFNRMITSFVIHQTENILDARVDLKHAQLQFSPFGLQLTDFGVYTPQNPSSYEFFSSEINLSLHLTLLFKRNFIIENISIESVHSNYPRTPTTQDLKHLTSLNNDSSIINQQPKKITPTLDNSTNTPSVNSSPNGFLDNDILDSFNLHLVDTATQLETDFQRDYDDIKSSISNSHIDDLLAEFITQFNDIITTFDINHIQDSKKKLDSLLLQAIQLKTTIENQKQQLSKTIKQQQKSLNKLNEARKIDAAAIKATFQVNNYKTGHISSMVFGSDITKSIETGLKYSNMAIDLINRLQRDQTTNTSSTSSKKGTYFDFSDTNPFPRIWIKHILFSNKETQLMARITNLSSNANIIDLPIQITYKDFQQTISGTIDTRSNKIVQDYHFYSTPTQLTNLHLISMDSFTYGLESATQVLTGSFTLTGSELAGQATLSIENMIPKTTVAPNSDTISASNAIVNTLSDIDTISVLCELSGRVYKPNFSFSSTLDTALDTSFKQALTQQQNLINKKIDDYLNKQLLISKRQLLSTNNTRSTLMQSALESQYSDVSSLIATIENEDNMMQKKLDAAVQRELQKQQETLQSEQDVLEEKLQKQAEQELKDLQQDAEDLLKSLF